MGGGAAEAAVEGAFRRLGCPASSPTARLRPEEAAVPKACRLQAAWPGLLRDRTSLWVRAALWADLGQPWRPVCSDKAGLVKRGL